jgi:hypothetical protein
MHDLADTYLGLGGTTTMYLSASDTIEVYVSNYSTHYMGRSIPEKEKKWQKVYWLKLGK